MSKQRRIGRLREKMAAESLDAFLVTSKENRHYFSGFRGSAGALWITKDDAMLATDFRYTEQAELQAPDYRIVRIGGGLEWLKEEVSGAGVQRIGIESGDMTVGLFNAVNEALKEVEPQPELVPTGTMAEELRAVKEPEELVLLEEAIRIADVAMEAVGAQLHPGLTEREIAWMLEREMRENGADALSFDTIVASGPNGAKPHHKPTDRAIERGDGVTIDMGALYEGYCSDITRTFVLGKAGERFREVYDIVLAAQLAAEESARVGMTGQEVDGIARKVIEDAGYPEAFGHSLGHGIGVAVHEFPRVGPFSDKQVIENGMVFSVEPGIYLTGWGGVRIEDLVVMEGGVPRVITSAHKRDLVEV